MLLALLAASASAQPVSRVPPGAAAVTVMLCPRADGCAPEWRALAAHTGPLGLPLLDFDVVAAAGPGGRDRLLAVEALLGPVRAGTAQAADISGALAGLEDLPFTIAEADLFRLWLAEGANRFPSVEADRALAAAASVSLGRVTDLGTLGEGVLARYLDLAADARPTATLRVRADTPGRVFVDGRPVGEAPVTVAVAAGWHRVSVERTGRLTAWVGAVDAPDGATLDVRAVLGPDDGAAALEAAVIAARKGLPAPTASVEALRAWGRANGLTWVRFVELAPSGGVSALVEPPEERFADPDPSSPAWDLHAVYLDVPAGRLGPRGPGPAAMVVAGDPDRFRLGVSLGYLRLQELQDTDAIPAHDHVTVEIAGQLRLLPALSLDVRLGLAHSAQPYYLDEDWLDDNVYPVSVGARLGRATGGPYVAGGALVIVPYALGGQLLAGWDLAPATAWRIAPEVRAGFVDKGWLVGGTIVVSRLR
ncbi:MAG: PEGA domain-containing protein [Pseudomonadota bacterium]|nr:PEGA domain-containing protein [Pseudomonadota bacterium]